MERDILFIIPLLFEIVSSNNSFLEIEFVVPASSTEQSVREMYDEMCKKGIIYKVSIDWLFLYPVVKIRIQKGN
jgi:hypothetical protein